MVSLDERSDYAGVRADEVATIKGRRALRNAAMRGVRWALVLALISACSAPVESAGSPSDAPKAAAISSNQVREPAREHGSEALRGPLVIFLGDSIAAGLHLPAEQAFPAVLQRKLSARGTPFRLLNAGVSGDTSAGGLRRVEWLLKQKPDVVVVELGANDGLRGVPVEDIEANLRAIVHKIKAGGARPVLLGMRIPPSYGADYAEGFAEMYTRIAKDLSVPFVPYFMEGVAGVSELNLEDGLHPTARGHERIADRLVTVFSGLVRDDG